MDVVNLCQLILLIVFVSVHCKDKFFLFMASYKSSVSNEPQFDLSGCLYFLDDVFIKMKMVE